MGDGRVPVTVIGLGMMGRALARAFLAGEHPTTVWNRTAGRAEELVAAGAAGADSVAAAVSASPLVVVCVRDYQAAYEILGPVSDALAGRLLVNLTSGTSAQARAMAGWAAERGAGYLDGAIMMTPPGIGTAEAVILYGGPSETFAAHRPALTALGGGTIHLGADVGLASVYDVALLGIMWSTFNGFMHAAALVGSENVPATTFLPLARQWLTGVASFLTPYAEQIDTGDYTASDATLETHLSPVEHLIEESRARGIDATAAEYTKRLVEEAVANGHALDSYARIVEHFTPALRA
ncbi:NAD(P)-binding domain-containing protein [Micromonospora sp. KC213]|uniref:NAD(P)-dependent oxidoreductase n=1 Tax=Micromonospora sp. KC213 TaxID=2530378 RepID=UPI00104B61CA|nr:NAD(P)-binding domain-containing protein [Micromonospora sp. KC213]TDC44136.1 NAD(P)-dependent oxidoreductase [Micromonospora sp. KC213]